MTTGEQSAPIVREVRVALDPAAAFELFTTGLDTWWPLGTHSIAADTYEGRVRAERIEWEPREGGSVTEVMSNGERAPWAVIRKWDPPHIVVLAWKPNLSDGPRTEVEVRFTPDGEGTLVRLEHRGWEVFGADAPARRANYVAGWQGLLEMYRRATG